VVLVTGGTGFLGSTLIKRLVEGGVAVLATKRCGSVVPETLASSPLVRWVEADVTDYFALADAFSGVAKVYHCAAVVSYQKRDWPAMLRTNIEGTRHIVNLCLERGARLLHVSSVAALGVGKAGEPVGEDSQWDENAAHSCYSLSKYESEMEVRRGIAEGLDAVIVNPSVIMGIGAAGKGSGAIFDLVRKGLRIYPPGTLGIVDVEDVANLMVRLMDMPGLSGERFVLNSENLTNKNLLERIAALLGKPAPTIPAGRFLLGIAWRMARLIALLTNEHPALTRETARAAMAKLAYSNRKITDLTGYAFKPADATLAEMGAAYL